MRRSLPPMVRGFTLLETMVVVTIVGILAALAVYSVKRYLLSAKSAEARQMILAIKAAEETYREETYVFKSASAAGVSDSGQASLYPQVCVGGQPPGMRKYAWEQPIGCTDAAEWRELGVTSTNPVQFGYAVTFVQQGANMPKIGSYDWGSVATAPGPAFAVVARGDLDGNSAFSLFLGSNFTDEIYVENEDD